MGKKGRGEEHDTTTHLIKFHVFTHASCVAAKRGLYSGSIEACMASLRVSKTSFLVGTRTPALSPGASLSDIQVCGPHIYSLAGLD